MTPARELPARRRAGGRILRMALVLLATALLLELGVRAVLFGWVAVDWKPLRGLRQADTFADQNEDAWWLLQRHFGAGTSANLQPEAPTFHPELGWVPGGRVNSISYDHRGRTGLGARRPVLLYGDSFAMCLTPEEECFQGLLERSELGERFALMNYGCGGYGLDQTYLTFKRTLELWAELEPIVLISLLVEDDMDRSLLEFRGWTKPRLRIRGGELVLERAEVSTSTEYFEREFPPLTSWAWRALVRSKALPQPVRDALSGRRRRGRRTRELSTLMIEDAVGELRRRELSFGFVLFCGPQGTRSAERLGWRETFLLDLMERLEVPHVLARLAIAEDAAATGEPLGRYFILEDPGRGHYNARGNEVVFRQMQILLEDLGGEDAYAPPPGPWRIADTVLGGRFAAARYENGIRRPFEELEDMSRLMLKVGARGPTEVHYELDGRARVFAGLAWVPPGPGKQAGSVTLTLLADGAPLLERGLRAGEPKVPVEVDLTGRGRLVIRVDDGGDGFGGDLLVVSSPRFD